MVARDDGANFIAGGVGARRFLGAARRRDDKLIARKNQFRGHAFARFGSASSSRRARRSRSEASTSAGLRTSMMSHGSVEPIRVAVSSFGEIDLEKSRDSRARLRAHNRAPARSDKPPGESSPGQS